MKQFCVKIIFLTTVYLLFSAFPSFNINLNKNFHINNIKKKGILLPDERPILLNGSYDLKIHGITFYTPTRFIVEPIVSYNFLNPQYAHMAPEPMKISFFPDFLDPNLRIAHLEKRQLSTRSLNAMDAEERSGLVKLFYSAMTSDIEGGSFDSRMDECQDPTDDQFNDHESFYTLGTCSYFFFGMFPDLIHQEVIWGTADTRGNLVLPNFTLQVLNPYHKSLGRIFPEDMDLRLEFPVSLSTHVLDRAQGLEGFSLVPALDEGQIHAADLNLRTHQFADCPEAIFQNGVMNGRVNLASPEFNCFVTSGNSKYLKGSPIRAIPGTNKYTVTLAAVGRFPDNVRNQNLLPRDLFPHFSNVELFYPAFFRNGNEGAVVYLIFQAILEPTRI